MIRNTMGFERGSSCGRTTASNPSLRSSSHTVFEALWLALSLVLTTTTPLSSGGFVPSGTGPSRIVITASGSNTFHFASWRAEAKSKANESASKSFKLYWSRTDSPEKGLSRSASLDCWSFVSLRHATLSSILIRSSRSDSAIRCASAARATASADAEFAEAICASNRLAVATASAACFPRNAIIRPESTFVLTRHTSSAASPAISTKVANFPNLSLCSGMSLMQQTLEKSARNSPTTPAMTIAADAYSPYSHRVRVVSTVNVVF